MAIKNIIIPSNLGTEFDLGVVTLSKITVKAATSLVAGKVALAISTAYPLAGNDVLAATPAFVTSAINAAVAALPADKFLQSASWSTATSTLTLTMSNGTTFPVLLSDLLPIVTASSTSVLVTGAGTTASPATAALKLDPLVGNLLVVTTAGSKVDPASVTALSSIDVQDAFGVHLYYALP